MNDVKCKPARTGPSRYGINRTDEKSWRIWDTPDHNSRSNETVYLLRDNNSLTTKFPLRLYRDDGGPSSQDRLNRYQDSWRSDENGG